MIADDATGWWRLARPLVFRLDPEQAHDLTIGLLSRWSELFRPTAPATGPGLARRRMGIDFPNPLGLAAGLDKDARSVAAWQSLGFGFVEVGTVTALAQPGNPKPRLFRLPPDRAIINRMGFNNAGAEAMEQRLTKLRQRGLPKIPLGVNLGKSKVTPAARAADDYRSSFERLAPLADYCVVNISSPNTPGLRDLQTVTEVARILDAIQGPNQRLADPRPILLKLAPDLDDQAAIDCARAAIEGGCAGVVLTNTTIRFEGLKSETQGMSGGLSGAPLFERSTNLLQQVRETIGRKAVIVGVGGIMDPEGAKAKLAAGADLIQIYTGLIYGGPGLPRRILRALESRR